MHVTVRNMSTKKMMNFTFIEQPVVFCSRNTSMADGHLKVIPQISLRHFDHHPHRELHLGPATA
jgi:hypothetical protein